MSEDRDDDEPEGQTGGVAWVALPVPAKVMLGNGKEVDVSEPQALFLGDCGELYLVDQAGGPIRSVWSPAAWMAVHAAEEALQ